MCILHKTSVLIWNCCAARPPAPADQRVRHDRAHWAGGLVTYVSLLLLLLLQISVYGMNERIGLVSFPPRQEAFDKPYSQETAHMIDQEASTCQSIKAGWAVQ